MKMSRQHNFERRDRETLEQFARPIAPSPIHIERTASPAASFYVPPVIRRTTQPQIVTHPSGVTQRQGVSPDPRSGGYNGQPIQRVNGVNQPVQRLTVASTPAQIYGCCGLFDLCGDADLMSLSLQGIDPFLDWLGWEATAICKILKNFVTWARPNNAGATSGWVGDPCADANGIEWGGCDFTLTDFGRLRRQTPSRDLTRVGLRLCEQQPRYRLDGTPISDDSEYDTRITTEVLLQDLRRLIITGNKTTAGQFDGLERLINTGYVNSEGRNCDIMDSIVLDWNANDFDGGAGITWNGVAQSATTNFVTFLLAIYRRIRQRLSWAPTLSAPLRVGDMVFVAPTQTNQCLLDSYTCWSVCPGVQFNEANLNTFEAREFRDNLNGGMFGAGRIFLDGFEVPLINYDWGLIKGTTRADGYLLTGKVGNMRLINGQYNDMRVASNVLPNWYDVLDGGRLLSWVDTDNTCFTRTVEMDPRLLAWAPWSSARFIDLVCTNPGGFLSPDPTETSFFPETSFSVANC